MNEHPKEAAIRDVGRDLAGLRNARRTGALACFVVAAGLAACGEPTTQDSASASLEQGSGADPRAGEEAGGHEERDGTFEISLEVQQRFGIAVAPAGPGPVEVTLDLPGEIRPDPDKIVHVKPRFAGVAKRVDKHVGDTVKAGDVLAVLESTQSLSRYSIKAAIAGTVAEEHVAIGESVGTGHTLFTIIDTSVVWVELQVSVTDLQRVRKGAAVEVLLPGSLPAARGTIFFVNPVVDDMTRTAGARVILPNEGDLRPGLFVTGRVAVAQQQAEVSVPSSALVRDGDGWVVFVRKGDARFARQPVVVGLRGLNRAAIKSGLDAGAHVVSNGAFLVKSAAARGEMGAGHEH